MKGKEKDEQERGGRIEEDDKASEKEEKKEEHNIFEQRSLQNSWPLQGSFYKLGNIDHFLSIIHVGGLYSTDTLHIIAEAVSFVNTLHGSPFVAYFFAESYYDYNYDYQSCSFLL